MREAVGDAIDIMVDCHTRATPRMGMRFATALEPYGLYGFEEPCWPETIEKKGRLVRPSDKPGLGIEINEEEVKKHPFEQEMLQRTFYTDGSVGDW